tara:strand:+ start:441 stop:770 length:330 start_codon:yes stop_codon:yes gene_type:complete
MEQTNKKVLSLILDRVNGLAKEQLNLASQMSASMNKQDAINVELRSYLESNSKTNQKGLVEQVYEIKEELSVLKTDKKINAGKIGIATAIFTVVGTLVLKLLGLIKFIA